MNKKILCVVFAVLASGAVFALGEKFYCQWCGKSYTDRQTLAINDCRQNPNGKRHALYEGSEKKEYFCKFCGKKYGDILTMCINSCKDSPSKYHSPSVK